MRRLSSHLLRVFALAGVLLPACFAFPEAASSSAKTTSTHKASTAKLKTPTSKSKSAHSRTTSSRTSSGKGKRSKKVKGQQKIDSERTHQIQEALIRQHYLNGEPTGKWDASTEDALRRFQADNGWQNKTVPDSRALIKLGRCAILKYLDAGSRRQRSHSRRESAAALAQLTILCLRNITLHHSFVSWCTLSPSSVFKQLGTTKPAEARVKCNLVPLKEKADQTQVIYQSNAANERVLSILRFRGDLPEHVF
jgi:peptidoglycan hydrolase-like protein with peptidoglycan-binding domain